MNAQNTAHTHARTAALSGVARSVNHVGARTTHTAVGMQDITFKELGLHAQSQGAVTVEMSIGGASIAFALGALLVAAIRHHKKY